MNILAGQHQHQPGTRHQTSKLGEGRFVAELPSATDDTRAGNEPSRRLKVYNRGEGPYYGLILVGSAYSAVTFKTLLRIYAIQPQRPL